MNIEGVASVDPYKIVLRGMVANVVNALESEREYLKLSQL